MIDDSIHKSKNVIFRHSMPNDEILDTIQIGLENALDEHEKAEMANENVRKNTEGKESVLWPNKGNSRTMSMASGLDALDTLSQVRELAKED